MKTSAPKSSKATPKTDALRKMREDKDAASKAAAQAAKAPAPGKKKPASA